MIGLTETQTQMIIDILNQYRDIEEALVFGSRAMGTYKKGSDIDIALKGPISFDLLSQIKGKLENDIPLPYFFDVIAYESLTNQALRDHIDEYGQSIYKANFR